MKMVGVEVEDPKVVVALIFKAPWMVEIRVEPCSTMFPEPRMLPVIVKASAGEVVPIPTFPDPSMMKISPPPGSTLLTAKYPLVVEALSSRP